MSVPDRMSDRALPLLACSAGRRRDRSLGDVVCEHMLVLRHYLLVKIELTLDCSNLETTAAFWAAALRCSVDHLSEGRYVSLRSAEIVLSLQHVTEPKTVKNRMHLDLLVGDLETELSRLEALGATRLTTTAREEFGQTWFVLADPEGNEFCVARDQVSPLMSYG
jgi:predicted enzyme related to lactoylglutathione lyase